MAAGHDKEDQVRAERARAVGLFRYGLIREAADRTLTTKQRGRLVRALAAREHLGPFGDPVRVSRETIDRWIRDWRRGGFDALVPNPRRVSPHTPAEVLELAVALKKEVPARTATQVAAVLRAHLGWAPDERTVAAALRPARTQHATRRVTAASFRPVRGRGTQRALDRGCAARADGARPQGHPVRLPR